MRKRFCGIFVCAFFLAGTVTVSAQETTLYSDENTTITVPNSNPDQQRDSLISAGVSEILPPDKMVYTEQEVNDARSKSESSLIRLEASEDYMRQQPDNYNAGGDE